MLWKARLPPGSGCTTALRLADQFSTSSRGWIALMEGWRGEGFVILLYWNNYLSVSFEKLGPFLGQNSTSAGSFRRKEALKADFQNIIQGKNKTCFLVSWNLLELLLYSPFFYIKQILPETHNLLLHRTCNFFTLPGGHSWGLLTDSAEILMGAEFIDLFGVAL